MFEADITKVVEEMSVHIRETEEDFILDIIFPYCQETLQRKINKAELKQIILRGSRPKGKWRRVVDKAGHWVWECDCKWQQRFATNFCPDCGADMRGEEDEDND